jgi:NCAIR mutase (PurE)-related protein
LRKGVSEVIYGAGKKPEQIKKIAEALSVGAAPVLITRISKETSDFIGAEYFEAARMGILGKFPKPNGVGKIAVATGGTTDIPVAEEAAVTAEALGNEVVRVYDVGVAGLHRLLSRLDVIMSANVVIAVAGMDGALASVIGGLSEAPVIAAPTSVGYGASFGGLSALLSMLNSCSTGVSVVNIDNGFGAGYLASKINHIGVS